MSEAALPAAVPISNSAPLARRRPRIRTLTAGLVVLGVIWRLHRYWVGMPIWGDEAFVAVNFAVRDLGDMFQPLLYGQICPLFFMWIEEAVSQWLGLSEWALRLVPFLAGIAGLLLFVRFARHVLPLTAAFCAIGIFAGSYFIARHSTEVKPYSLDLLVSLGLSMLGWSVFKEPRSISRWVVLILLAAVGIWSSYPSMFVGGAVGVLLTIGLVRNRFRSGYLLGWLVYGVVLCGSALWMHQTYAKPHAAQAARTFELESWSSTFPPVSEPWKLPIWFFVVHTGNLFAYPQGGAAPGSAATFALFVVGCLRLWRKNRPLLVLLIVPFLLTFVAAAMKAYPYGGSARVAQYLAPAICLLAGLGLSVVLRRFFNGVRLRRAWLITAIVLSIIPIGAIVEAAVKPYKHEKSLRRHLSVQWALEKTGPNDHWVIFNAIEKVPYAPWMGDWKGVGSEFLFNVMRFAPPGYQWSPPPETVELPPGGNVLVIAFFAARKDKVQFPVDLRDAYLAKIAERLGPYQYESYNIRNDPGALERLELYRFGPSRR